MFVYNRLSLFGKISLREWFTFSLLCPVLVCLLYKNYTKLYPQQEPPGNEIMVWRFFDKSFDKTIDKILIKYIIRY